MTQTLDEALSYGTSPGGIPFLNPLRMSWDPRSVNYQWFAASGTSCNNAVRLVSWPLNNLPGYISNGCRDLSDARSDGAVCHQSAVVTYPASADIFVPVGFVPSQRFHDPNHQFRHSEDISLQITALSSYGPLMCGNVGSQSLRDPDPQSALFVQLVEFLNVL